jgi:uncharacterized protein YdiU (UPF0061 family)
VGLKSIKPKHNFVKGRQLYNSFRKLDGSHPWRDLVPSGYVDYPVREAPNGKVSYFNFQLAKEMGLIPQHHPHQLNSALEGMVLETLSLQILNEFDQNQMQKSGKKVENLKTFRCMATRYLQLQHKSRVGKTSGDGRGIWNGQIHFQGKSWDVSSRGTGVTCLAPGAVEAERPLRTGNEEFGYGCGQAEIDELLAAAIMSELLHLQGMHTERVLCIIDLGKGVGIGVRAAPSLIRPAHLFALSKQEKFKELKAVVDYLILGTSVKNNRASIESKYETWAKQSAVAFAKFCAQLDVNYIFAWLDWDGDNVLIDAGIIDYGSVRQFGIRHDEYRYDDVDRFSTNLNEQKNKTKLIVQNFAQIADYLKTGKRKPLKHFQQSAPVKLFEEEFKRYRRDSLLFRLGFLAPQRNAILNSNHKLVVGFENAFLELERVKISGPKIKVADGVNHPALFNLRKVIVYLTGFFSEKGLNSSPDSQLLFKVALSGFAKRQDAKLTKKYEGYWADFSNQFRKILEKAFYINKNDQEKILKENLRQLHERAVQLNQDDRITGNGLISAVEMIISEMKRNNDAGIFQQRIIDQLIYHYSGNVELAKNDKFQGPRVIHYPEFFEKILETIRLHQEEI